MTAEQLTNVKIISVEPPPGSLDCQFLLHANASLERTALLMVRDTHGTSRYSLRLLLSRLVPNWSTTSLCVILRRKADKERKRLAITSLPTSPGGSYPPSRVRGEVSSEPVDGLR